MDNLKSFMLAVFAGFSIGLGGICYLSMENHVVGALFFTVGLFTVCTYGFALFTGKVGYVLDNPPCYLGNVAIVWLGNLVGTTICAYMIAATRAPIVEKAIAVSNVKLSDGLISIFILAIFCNILMYIAVDGFKYNPHEVGKYIGLFICVAGFILCGFEHCVANMFYFSLAGVWSAKALLYMLVMTLGNAVGGIFYNFGKKCTTWIKYES